MCVQTFIVHGQTNFCQKLSLRIKDGSFNMIRKAKDKVCNETADTPTTQESSHVKITNEENAQHFP
jgi:hypothetical protein